MKYGSIAGGATTTGYASWIDLDSFQWGVGRGVGSVSRGEDTREGSEPSVSEVVVSKRMDKSSPKLWQDAVGGDFSNDVTICFTTTTKDKVTTYLQYTLTKVGLSGYSASGGANDPPGESLSLNFATVSWTYTPMSSGVSGTPETVGWDLTKQAKL